MGRFLKLNNNIQILGMKMLQDQDLCKLIYYSDTEIINKPNVDPDDILHKRLLLFTSKLPLADQTGTYVNIRPYRFNPNNSGHFIISLLCFDIYVHQDIRRVIFKDDNNKFISGDRALVIMDKIDSFMNSNKNNVCVSKANLDGGAEIDTRNAVFAGFTLGYKDISFRQSG